MRFDSSVTKLSMQEFYQQKLQKKNPLLKHNQSDDASAKPWSWLENEP